MRPYIYRKGISELLALVLGLAITIAIGIAFYAFLPSFLNTSLQQQKIAVSISSATLLTSNEAVMIINIKNLGSKNIENFSIYVEVENIKNINVSSTREDICPPPSQSTNESTSVLECRYSIQPGQEISLPIKISNVSGGFKVGQRIVVSVMARYVDGSIAAASATGTIY